MNSPSQSADDSPGFEPKIEESVCTMKKLTLPILGLLLAAGAVFYVGDYCVWRIRVASGGRGYDTLTVQYYYAIGEKNGKTEYDFQPPQPETCVNAIFPHGGYSPCWYERRHTEKMIQI